MTDPEPATLDRVAEIVSRAGDLSGEVRDAYLDGACGSDQALREEIVAMLAAHDARQETDRDLPAAPVSGVTPHDVTVASDISEKPGDTIGRYKLLQQIGEGGFGVVYMAEQEHPVRRRVALKIIKLGMDTKQVIARFEAERQALAMMDHPNIARVLDGGATETGRPYFVMELVRGVPITEYCDDHNLSVEERLILFQHVSRAVQHAHQKGIIHRDIKPSNVLITEHDNRPVPKVIDFGIAKATNARLTEKTLFTEFRQFIGTPEYMSPEQAHTSGLDVDTRSDVYSLGVLLYELLTGTTPFDSEKLRSAGYAEIQRIIREDTPHKPSTRLSALDTLPSIAARRHTEPKKLGLLIRGDLDWIVMKALEKDRSRRYETANGFAADIQRYLDNEPVVASPPSASYRLRKFARRNRRTLAAATAVFVVLVAGVITSTTFAINASSARDDAQRQQSAAEAERQVAEASLDFMIELFEIPDPSESRGNAITAREILDRGVTAIEGEFADQPAVRGRLLHTMGLVYINIGLFRDAIPMLDDAVRARREATDKDDAAVADSLLRLGEAHHYNLDIEQAERHYRQALALYRSTYGEDHADIATTLDLLSRAMRDLNQFEDARQFAEDGLAMRLRVLNPAHPDVSESHQSIGFVEYLEGHLDEAERHVRRAFEIRRAAFGDDHAQIPELLHFLGRISNDRGNREQAIEDLELCLEMSRRIFGLRHQNVGHTCFALAVTLNDDGQLDEAEAMYDEALGIYRTEFGERSFNAGVVIVSIGTLLMNRKDLPAAESQFREAIGIYRALGASGEFELAKALRRLGENLHQQQRYDEAEPPLLESHDILARLFDTGEPHYLAIQAMDALIQLYKDWGRPDDAEQWRALRPVQGADGYDE